MKTRKLLFVILLASSLSCNLVTRAIFPPTPTPTSTPTPPPTLTPVPTASSTPEPSATPFDVYAPASCQGQPLATLPAATEQALPTPGLDANPTISTDDQLRLFDRVVNRINSVYLYKDFNGVDWKGIAATYRARVKAGMDTETFYTEMGKLLAELKDDHSAFLSPVEAAAADVEMSGQQDYVGIGVLAKPDLEKKRAMILSVFADSPAEHAGLKPHDSILATDGLPIVDNGNYYLYRVRGPECSAVVLTVQSPGQEPRQVGLVRYRITAPIPIEAQLVNTSDGSRIGYIFLSSFEDDTLPERVRQALEDFGKLDGLIIDNRYNSGGSSTVVEPILAYFTDGVVGHFAGHSSSRAMEVNANPINNSQTVPLVVLVGEGSVSFGEIFSGILQDIGRAKVVGKTTDGNVELLHVYEFNDGSRIWIAEERFVPKVSKANWEKDGIIPDVQAFADWDTFTFESDPAIAAALKLLGHR